MHGLCLKEQQAKESTHGGYVTHQKRHHHLVQRLAVIGSITQRMQEMERIVGRYTHYHGTYPYHNY